MKRRVDEYIDDICKEKTLENMSLQELKILEKEFNKSFIEIHKEHMLIQESKDTDLILAIKLSLTLFAIGLFFIQVAIIKTISKPNPELTKLCRTIVGNNKWSVNEISMPDEKGREIPNAFSTGQTTVYVTKGLLQLVNKNESVAISLHEISHSDTADTHKQITAGIGGDTFAAILLKTLEKMFKLEFPSFLLIAALTYISIYLGKMKLSRTMEFKSDNYATKFGYGEYIISALKKMTEFYRKYYGIKESNPKGKIAKLIAYISNLLSTHPSLKERTENILKQKKFYEAIAKGPNAVKNFTKKAI